MSRSIEFPPNVLFCEVAKKDFRGLDGSQKLLVAKAIRKVSTNPAPASEGGYGKPPGNHNQAALAGLLKIKLRDAGIRIVYAYIRDIDGMHIIIISMRDEGFVYQQAERRLHNEQRRTDGHP